ncbi:MAG: UvrD-helicase domain-containing protein [Bacillota bacterium]
MFIADFHIHSRYSRATSKDCIPEMLELWARRKGLDLIGTGDFTHPAWREELREKLTPAAEGLYALKDEFRREDGTAGSNRNPHFVISGEISSIYKKNGKVRKVHNLILLPSLESAEALSQRLEAIGNLHSDGRPILGLDSRDLLEITLNACPEAIFIPAHIWTPHFSLFGAYSGFDGIEECFGDLTRYIHALETGLSSDPAMNRRISALDRFTLVSNSDAHSPANLAREANLFDTELSYPHILRALQNCDTKEFFGTIEFFPEEGKYHYDGHRNCGVCLKPADTLAASGICPVCGGRITVGVLHRVELLADREEGFVPPTTKHFESLIPLREVIAASTGLSLAGRKVQEEYERLLQTLGPELFILREAQLGDIERKAGPFVAEGIRRLRSGEVEILPGYDGEYGKIKILDKQTIDLLSGQQSLFDGEQSGALGARPARKPKSPAGKAHAVPEPAAAPPRKKDGNEAQAAGPDTFDGLNQEQREAVCAADSVIAVIAGPGTGKTRTLVNRIAFLVQTCGVSPSQITAVTFTNRAAQEMRARLIKHFGDGQIVKAMTIGTFHAICLQLLSKKDGDITVIDEQDSLSIVEEILRGLRIKSSPRDVLRAISLVKSGALPREGNPDLLPGIYDSYCGQLAQYDVLDYDDILLKTLELFEGVDAGADQSLYKPFSHLLVDEFQDINPVQYRLIRAWGKHSAGIFVIGDPDQSIYGFRGADALCFERLFTEQPQARLFRLTQNYRSTPEIVGCARSVILQGQTEKDGAALEAKRESGGRVRLLEADDEFAEALFVAKEINRLVGGIDMLDAHALPASSGERAVSRLARGFSDIAVLYRTNRQAKVLEQHLLKEGIPYIVAGRDEFLADPEIRKAVAFFRFLLAPNDLVSLRVCLGSVAMCKGELLKEFLKRYAAAEKSIASFSAVAEGCLPSAPAGLPDFLELLCKYEPLVSGAKPYELLESWIRDAGLQDAGCMEILLNMAVLHKGMRSLLQNLLLGQEGDVLRSGGRRYSPDAVSLMTLHGAKGLEFPVVFLCGVKDGYIPLKNRSGECNYDEERRLLYVGMTRAQDELILLSAPTRSPFLAVLPEESVLTGQALERRKTPEYEQIGLF